MNDLSEVKFIQGTVKYAMYSSTDDMAPVMGTETVSFSRSWLTAPPGVHNRYDLKMSSVSCQLFVTHEMGPSVRGLKEIIGNHTILHDVLGEAIANFVRDPLTIKAFGSLCSTWVSVTGWWNKEPDIPLQVDFKGNRIIIRDPRQTYTYLELLIEDVIRGVSR